jgi:adenylylsulfate kinase
MDAGQIRSVLKSISFRIIATLTTIILVYGLTDKWSIAMGIGMVEFTSKLALYYLHERVWNRIHFGRQFPVQNTEPIKKPVLQSRN